MMKMMRILIHQVLKEPDFRIALQELSQIRRVDVSLAERIAHLAKTLKSAIPALTRTTLYSKEFAPAIIKIKTVQSKMVAISVLMVASITLGRAAVRNVCKAVANAGEGKLVISVWKAGPISKASALVSVR